MTEPTRLTKNQIATLAEMAKGAQLVWLIHSRSDPSEHLSDHRRRLSAFPKVRLGTSYKFLQMGLIKMISDPGWAWRNKDYVITEKGRELLRKRGKSDY